MMSYDDSDSDDSISAGKNMTWNGFIIEDDPTHAHDETSRPKEKLYCICRSNNDIERFMIMCEKCEEWFHGDCINVSEEKASHIKNFYCTDCLTAYPRLKIIYQDNITERNVSTTSFTGAQHSNKKQQNNIFMNTKKCDKCSNSYTSKSNNLNDIYIGKNIQVLCMYKGEAKIYDSTIIKIRKGKKKCYQIHYVGYNHRHDTWIAANQIHSDSSKRQCVCP